ncbi:MAG: rhomboid family intramembrane serine protease [Gemmatimonadetes bacterium]|nr:rhomboid family intramembrane serine protease [Gemmatimonadota bacterium]
MPLRSPLSLTPWVRRLLFANAAVYLLTITVFTGPWVLQTFGFTPLAAVREPWTVVTHLFLHGSFFHLVFNMLALFFFGPAVEERMGGWPFARYYLLCGLGGAALSFAVALVAPATVIGASAAVLGVTLAFAVYWPDQEVFIFPLPFPIKVKWFVVLLAAIDLFPALRDLLIGRAGSGDGIAHFAHLGGLLVGLLYLKGEVWFGAHPRAAPQRPSEARVLVHPSAEVARQRAAPRTRRDRDEAIQREVDRVLDKISATGIGSLTAEERRLLDEMSKQLKKE